MVRKNEGVTDLQSRGESISTLALVAIASAYMLTALGAYLFTWRRLSGLLFVCVPAVALFVVGSVPAALLVGGVVLLAFSTPFLLVYLAARNRQLQTFKKPNNALERPVKSLAVGAAGARTIVAPAAPGGGRRRAAQRGR